MDTPAIKRAARPAIRSAIAQPSSVRMAMPRPANPTAASKPRAGRRLLAAAEPFARHDQPGAPLHRRSNVLCRVTRSFIISLLPRDSFSSRASVTICRSAMQQDAQELVTALSDMATYGFEREVVSPCPQRLRPGVGIRPESITVSSTSK